MSDLGALVGLAGRSIFSTSSPWRELAGYRLASAPLTRFEIYVVVARDAVTVDDFAQSVPAHQVTVRVANDATVGVDRPREGDLIDFLDAVEGDRWEWEVVEIVTGDAGRWQLRVEKRQRYTP